MGRIGKLAAKTAKFFTDPQARFLFLAKCGLYNGLSDEQYLKKKFKIMMGYELNLACPKTFNEKLQWLKLHNRRPEYTMMVDKYKVREYIADKLGEEYLIPLLGVWDDPDEIDFDKLPNQFVLKCNHNSGLGMCICKDKSKLDISAVKKGLRKGLEQDYFLPGREWPYKNVPRKIICEKYMKMEGCSELTDYKYMCFNGKVKCVFVCSERFSADGLKITIFDRNWSALPVKRDYLKSDKNIPMPKFHHKMMELAEVLSEGIPFIRVDFYEINNHIYFGELTFFPASGFEKFTPEEWDYKLGEWISLA